MWQPIHLRCLDREWLYPHRSLQNYKHLIMWHIHYFRRNVCNLFAILFILKVNNLCGYTLRP